MNTTVAIIGGGVSGMMAGITVARNNTPVIIIDHNPDLGRKMLVTGSGRCNLTHTSLEPNNYHGQNPDFVRNVFARFNERDTVNFFRQLGILLYTESDGRVFPVTNQASTVVSVLKHELVDLGVTVKVNTRVYGIEKNKDKFIIDTGGTKLTVNKVIICTGGKTYPQLGSTEDGYEFARKFGHTIIPVRPALVPIELYDKWCHYLQGVKLNCELVISLNFKKIVTCQGELLFTHFGISGPVTLKLSRYIGEYLSNDTIKLYLNFFPGYRPADLTTLIFNLWNKKPIRTLSTILAGFIPSRLAITLVKLLGQENQQLADFTKEDRTHLINRLLAWEVKVKKLRPFNEAQVTVGGVCTKEISPQTMESKFVKGLFFAGEVVDIDGDCGGYNIQWALSSGYLAGLSYDDK